MAWNEPTSIIGAMFSLLPKLSDRLSRLVQSAERDLLICSPFIGSEGTDFVLAHLSDRFRHTGKLHFLTDLSAASACQSSTDPRAVLHLSQQMAIATIAHLPRLHAKVYISDNTAAIITSANLTRSGLYRNYEYGVEISDISAVSRIRADLVMYGALGALVQIAALEKYCDIVDGLRGKFLKTERTAARQIRAHLRVAEDELMRMRLQNGAMHTVFEKTIEYLLSRHGPMPTEELHLHVARIHPDLCDDTVDRVIDGRRFGKKWKHAVRTAQQKLKQKGVIERDHNSWRFTSS